MTKFTLITILLMVVISTTISQNLDFHEDFSNYTSGQTPYNGFITWNINNTSSATLNGNAISLTSGGSSIEAIIPGGLSTLRCVITGSKTNLSLLITITNSNSTILFQNSYSTTKNQATEVLIPALTPETNSTITFENTTSGGGNNKDITIDDISWNGFTIYELQYTTDPSGDSPQNNNIISTSGTVTGINTSGYYIQESDGSLDGNGAGDWSAIYVEDANLTPLLTDIVAITGIIDESTGKTTIVVTGISDYYAKTINPEGGVEPIANLIIGPLGEKDESVLSAIRDCRYVANNYSTGNYSMTIGFDENESNNTLVPIDNNIITTSEPTATPRLYDITGPVNFNTYFRISPRDNLLDIYEGVDLATSARLKKNSTSKVFGDTHRIIVESKDTYAIQVYNISGQKIRELRAIQGRTEIEMENGIFIVNLISAGTVETAKVFIR